jgi:hypothetical protein
MIKFDRVWSMPNKNTFEIPEVMAFIRKHTNGAKIIINPMCGLTRIGTHTNDLNPAVPADEHMEALDYLKKQESGFADLLLFDPPFSARQSKEMYDSFGLENFYKNSGWIWNIKNELARTGKPGSIAIVCGWNSAGLGKKKNNYELFDGLVVCHGASHNDTICTAERKSTKGGEHR